ncbi:MAG TPA: YoaK family protein [Candidatus Didemnitutus sp.]|nr:YoaK family protein [Candidatus Didemnitutus sp.]
MVRKLERWVWIGGGLLALNGGMVNSVGLSSIAQQTVSHVTGTTTLFALAVGQGNSEMILRAGALVLAFAAGAALAGMIVKSESLKRGRRYAAALGLEAGLLAVAALVMREHLMPGLLVTTAACGLQNGLASTYSGAILRTTHMTGVITDLGATAGYLLGRAPVDGLRARLHGMLLTAFMGGAIIGGFLYVRIGWRVLFLAAALTASLAILYSVLVRPDPDQQSPTP